MSVFYIAASAWKSNDLHVIDAHRLNFDYRPLGDVDYLTILRRMRDHGCDVFRSLATHFRPPSGSREEAMKINYRNLREMIRQVEAER